MTKRKWAGKAEPFKKRRREWRMRFDGNYCGPGWSNAQYQDSVAAGTVSPATPLDALCKAHDESYGSQGNRKTADFNFAKRAAGLLGTPLTLEQVFKVTAAGAAVGLQGVARQLNFIGDERVLRIESGPEVKRIDGGIKVTAPDPHFFSILKMPKYARRKRTGRRSRRRLYPKRKRTTIKKRYKRNKTRRSYRSRGRGRKSSVPYNHSTMRLEYGNAISDPQHVTVGQGTSPTNVLFVASMSIVKQLFRNHGQVFVNFDEYANETDVTDDRILQIRTTWQFGIANTSTSYTYIGVNSSKTYRQCAVDWYQEVVEQCNSEQEAIYCQRVELLITDDAQEQVFAILASLDTRRMKLHWRYGSSLRMQNRTAAGTNGANIDVNNVNPLEGRVYFQKSGMNYFEPSYKPKGPEVLYKGMCPYSSTGAWSNLYSENDLNPSLKEPPTGAMVGAIKVKKFALHPGQVMVDTLSMKGTIYFNNFLNKVFAAFCKAGVSIEDDYQLPALFGNVRAYNFEKLVFDRSETAQVAVGYEVNQNYSCSISFKKLRSEPVTIIYPLA